MSLSLSRSNGTPRTNNSLDYSKIDNKKDFRQLKEKFPLAFINLMKEMVDPSKSNTISYSYSCNHIPINKGRQSLNETRNQKNHYSVSIFETLKQKVDTHTLKYFNINEYNTRLKTIPTNLFTIKDKSKDERKEKIKSLKRLIFKQSPKSPLKLTDFNLNKVHYDPFRIIYEKNQKPKIINTENNYRNTYLQRINDKFPEYTSPNHKGLSFIRQRKEKRQIKNDRVEFFKSEINKIL
ncbi:MAG: hypothetical protein MJ252_11800 [archaeon]|nr:hypothetical protein [archaeon]